MPYTLYGALYTVHRIYDKSLRNGIFLILLVCPPNQFLRRNLPLSDSVWGESCLRFVFVAFSAFCPGPGSTDNKTRRDRRNQGETDATKQGRALKILEGFFFGTKGSKRSCKFPLFNIIKAGVGCSEWARRCWVCSGEPTRSWSSVS